ncbi:ribosome small subunit-dependent GTPase A [Buchananella hordeovulneris]|uniref:ribosome small subunit-dependent GTPase A n=1 Tax=Buchananella hordeovulneris TaxID=52770 RepID=UPI00130144B0|nr:ribosome small subunit-dependent GTPase A [Buchananella hordeovulneris]
MEYQELGWDQRWQAYLAVASLSARSELQAGRVVAVHRGALQVALLPPSPAAAPAVVSLDLALPGHTAEQADWPPVVGDWLAVRGASAAQMRVATVLPRRTYLERPSATGSSLGQPVAANVDILLIVEPFSPPPTPGRVERFTALARAAGMQAWLVLTKADLVPPAQAAAVVTDLGRHTDQALAVSAHNPASLRALRALLPSGTTAVLVGRSGAGKSTLTNALLGTQLATQAVRAGDGKGRHTTTSRQLVTGQGLNLIDTPGIRALAATTDAAAIDDAFADIAELAAHCRFPDCGHGSERDCAVQAAVATGQVEAERVARYLRLQQESARLAQRQDARLARAQDRRASRDNTRGRRGVMRLKGK